MSCGSSRDQTVLFPFALTSPRAAPLPATHRAPVCWNRNRKEGSTKGKKQCWRVHGERRGHAQEKAVTVKKKLLTASQKTTQLQLYAAIAPAQGDCLLCRPKSVLSVQSLCFAWERMKATQVPAYLSGSSGPQCHCSG